MRAAYDKIYYQLKESICQGDYACGDLLPSESVLTKHFGCAHNTVRKAIAHLAAEGYVTPIHGKGVRVIWKAAPMLHARMSPAEPGGFDVLGPDPLATVDLLERRDLVASPSLAAEHGFEAGACLAYLERLRSHDGVPYACERVLAREDLVPKSRTELSGESVPELLREAGSHVSTVESAVFCEPADADVRALLGLAEHAFVAVVTQAFFDHRGFVCATADIRYRPEDFTFFSTRVHSRVS